MGNKPKTFSLLWGSGIVEEEVKIQCKYHVPTIQLLKFNAGERKAVMKFVFVITIMKDVFSAPRLS